MCIRIIYRVSPNATYKLGWEVENIVRSHNYIKVHRRKAIGGAVRELTMSKHVVSSFQTEMNMNRYTSTKLADIHFIYDLANGNGCVAVRLYRERYPQ
ncbi:uncharacterized protein TNCV_2298681 [Trichonephila clavipes]|nr:uncharacterized protein TNCV_2298681 [Trichonephila clavipes]